MLNNNDLEVVDIDRELEEDPDKQAKLHDADNIFGDENTSDAKALDFQFEPAKSKDDLIISGRQPEIFNAFKHGGDGPDVGQVDVPDDLSSQMDDE